MRIHVTGIVQGVGFRPFVYREAVARHLSGWVMNAVDGVHIEAQGPLPALNSLVRALSEDAPAAARVKSVEVEEADEEGKRGEGPAAGLSDQATEEDLQDLRAPTDEEGSSGFRIIASDGAGERTTLVSPDIATCPDCVRELFDPADRRYHYPFINCTNCGPRFTIIRSLPYDRAQTSMSVFPMCPACAAEYADPLNRRFHAQPNACFACGPHLTWRERDGLDRQSCETGASDGAPSSKEPPNQMTPAEGRTREESDAIIEQCAAMLAAGGIVAIKGLGGFHLACSAQSDAAVRELRRRKRRSNKPLAIMMRSLESVRRLCLVDEAEEQLLTGSIRPIVLLRRTQQAPAVAADALAPSVAFDLPELGVMLPYTPLQHLLMEACERAGIAAIVMTSGNISEEPIEVDDDLAWDHLVGGGLADALLGNDRAILSRYDDSVVRVVDGATQLVRRARGYAPAPLELPAAFGTAPCQSILACGSEQKATIALTREAAPDAAADASGAASDLRAPGAASNPGATSNHDAAGDAGTANALCFVSQHIGDVENGGTFSAWTEARKRLESLFDLRPQAMACDLHPSYLPSQWARNQAEERRLPLLEVQHHHAHITSAIAEAAAAHAIDASHPVIGIALDGTGAGTDGTIWGGELLVATLDGFERVAHLATWALPGGAASVRDARRNAFSLLLETGFEGHPGAQPLIRALDEQTRSITRTMIDRGINSPLTSSMGRFMDAIAALTGTCLQATYEGEPAIALEAAAWRAQGATGHSDSDKRYRLSIVEDDAPIAPAALDAMQRVGEGPAELRRILDPHPLIGAVLDDLAASVPAELIALRAHEGIARSIVQAASLISRERGISTIALSGGVWMNRLLLTRVRSLLEAQGLKVLVPQTVPVNDGCISYGQAAVARARLARPR